MKDVVLTSSVLILTLLILRRLFRKSLSRRAQYALWGLVLLRLLIPVSLPAAEFSVLTAAEPVVGNLEALYIAPESMSVRRSDGGWVWGPPDLPPVAVGPATPGNTCDFSDRDALQNPVVGFMTYRWQFLLKDILPPIWYGGMAAMACWLLLSNLLFWRKLRKRRIPYAAEGVRRPVYLVESGLPSPCLFGLFRPAIYLTPAAAASPESLRHVLAHEETHARHGDPLWSLLRGLCLVIYWFDPLVWWAALASRSDCELACDEGALQRLGEAERVPYGRTLLALVPVRWTPANPLLSATTMTADKRRLLDRITRIAENRKSLRTALFAAAALAALTCAVTFTGAKAADEASRPLTRGELDYFNTEFFTEPCGQGVNRRRQFLTSFYDSPQNINPGELFFTGSGDAPPGEGSPEFFDVDWGDDFERRSSSGQELVKLSCSSINAILHEYTDVYLERPLFDSLYNDYFYVTAYDAFYFFKRPGDTNIHGSVTFSSGQREGNLVRLYYPAKQLYPLYADLVCLTLREKPGGGWWFVSNEQVLANRPSAAPDWAPISVIPLDGLEPWKPEVPEEISPFSSASGWEMLGGAADPDHILGGYGLMFFRGGGRVYAGVQNVLLSSWPPAFLELPGEAYSVTWFHDLFGHDGFAIHCDSQVQTSEDPPSYSFNGESFTNYYYLNDSGQPVLLASVPGLNPQVMDLDGDGEKELVSQHAFYSEILCFQRDGTIYRVDLDALLGAFWPPDTIFTFESWDASTRTLSFRALLNSFSSAFGNFQTEHRTLYFDGENLLVYNDQRHFKNHMVNWFDVPHQVRSTALDVVRQTFDAAGTPYDDWRITDLMGSGKLGADGQLYQVWRVDYEFHQPEPEYSPALHAPDCWADPCYPESMFLVFLDHSPEGTDLTYQFHLQQADWPSAEQLRIE